MDKNPVQKTKEMLDFVIDSDSEDEDIIRFLQLSGETGQSSRQVIPRTYIPRDREGAAQRLWDDYFSETPKYTPTMFKRRFRMRCQLFLRIVSGISQYSGDDIPDHFMFFKQRPDATGRQGLTPLQKCTSAIRQLAYGTAADMFDEYLQMSEKTSSNCLQNFCKCVIDLYTNEYMRNPTAQDIARLYSAHEEKHGFKGMLGSIDCMHWEWKNCPNAWKGQYTRGDQKHPTIMLEAVASYDMWIWHAFFGMTGSNNDINVLNQSPLFDSLKNGTAPPAPFDVNGRHYTKGYYLADGIYPDWVTLMKAFSTPTDEKRAKFKRFQESARKDVERTFGVLQGRFAILKSGARALSTNKIRQQLYTCVILHNMIQEDNGFAISSIEEEMLADPSNRPRRNIRTRGRDRDTVSREMRDKRVHDQLREDLVEHIWRLPPNFRTFH